MITNQEREHVRHLKRWSEEARAAFKQLSSGPIGLLLKRIPGGTDEVLFDNVDWLIAVIEREAYRQGVRNLTGTPRNSTAP